MNASDHDLGTASVECDFAGDWNPSNTPAVPPLSPQLEAFLLDRFSTTLEDPYTGRRLKS